MFYLHITDNLYRLTYKNNLNNKGEFLLLVRLSVHKLKCTYANLWTRLHNELLYKHHINLKARQSKSGNANTSLVSFLRDDEYKHAFSSLLAIFKYSGLTDVEINKLLQKAKM